MSTKQIKLNKTILKFMKISDRKNMLMETILNKKSSILKGSENDYSKIYWNFLVILSQKVTW